ncbi:hypothetical protein PV328_002401 [Microctonus aethiopoides]|uniref:Epidermal cell surface receptor n=2 Tax=Microctonus aethiopoides TaxID=144406 RepID=A0AA39F662_9HYME|nr:hypothetical protein PV328_002401 [Microctonus aethiopoides]
MRIHRIWITSLVLVAINLIGQKSSGTSALDQDIGQHYRTFLVNGAIARDDEIPGVIPRTLENNNSMNENNDVMTKIKVSSKKIETKFNENKNKLFEFGNNTNNSIKSRNGTKSQYPKYAKIFEGATITRSEYSTESTTIFLPTVQSTFNIRNETNKSIKSTFPSLFHGELIGNRALINMKKIANLLTTNDSNLTRGRALNVSTSSDVTNSLYANITDLSDVSMDEQDKEIEGGEYVAIHNDTNATIVPISIVNISMCVEGNKTYSIGENIVRGCDEKCVCGENGKMKNCTPLCVTPYVRAGRANNDPFCQEQKIDAEGCCAILLCTDSSLEAEETCLFGNKTLIRGQRAEDGCTKVCDCESGGSLKCRPRCPPNDTNSALNHHDRCVALADPRDPCCTITYCDVSLGEDEIKSENASDLTVSLTNIKILNSTAIKLILSSELSNGSFVEVSENNNLWRQQVSATDGIITMLEPARSYYVRIREGGRAGPALRVIMPAEVIKSNVTEKMDKNTCNHRGKVYKIGAEWYDDCLSICMCGEGTKIECITIECPTDFGLDVLDPHCVDWETVPPNFVPKAPNCCPQEVRCRNNGSCSYGNKTYDNWSDIPSNVTGCEKRCYCEMGKVSCQAVCPPVPVLPPSTLKCLANEAILAKLPNDDCCSHWICDHGESSILGMEDHNFHSGFPINGAIPEYTGQVSGQSSSSEIVIKAIDPLDDRTVRVIFTVSPVLVGLHGRVELRYTSDKSNLNPATWRSQVFIPPNDLIATPQLEFNLDGLEPATEYNVKVIVNLRDLTNSPTSKIYTVRTPAKYEEQTTLPPQIAIDAELSVMETNSSWVKVMWKKFTEYEMQFIDGVQLRYKERDGKVYAATPLIHRAVTSYAIENLKSATAYEIGISIIPFPGQTTELISEKTIHITTAKEPDPYSFDVKIEIKTVKSQDVELSWTGVPYPQDKYVNIYRAIYQSDSGKGDTSTFKIAKRDSTAKTVINDLKPGTRYRLWLEIYLTNGRIKKSNVQDFITKPGVILPAGISQQGKLASIPLHNGDYYGPLVIVAILASLAILSTLILLMILMKRRSSSKADISPRKTTSAYDNPSYKTCEDAVTTTNGRNKVMDHEMSAINSIIIAKENI